MTGLIEQLKTHVPTPSTYDMRVLFGGNLTESMALMDIYRNIDDKHKVKKYSIKKNLFKIYTEKEEYIISLDNKNIVFNGNKHKLLSFSENKRLANEITN